MTNFKRFAFLASNKNAGRLANDPAFHFRCTNFDQALPLLGSCVWQGHNTELSWWQQWDVVVFHRPRACWRVHWLTAWLKGRNTRIVADFDDLVFDPALANFSPGVVNGTVSLAKTKALFASHHRALSWFDQITVSTEPLAEHVRSLWPGKRVAVLPNAVHAQWRALPPSTVPTQPGLITYMPGTRSHDRDFAQVAGAVSRVLARNPHAQLSVTGPLNFEVPARPGQVVHHAKLPFDQYHRNLQGAKVNLAPLEASPFTRCKSALKVIEAAWWNIPTVCSPLPDAERLRGAGAFIAPDEASFEAQLERLLTDDAYHAQAVQGLRERILPLADIHQVAQDWLQFVMDSPAGAKR